MRYTPRRTGSSAGEPPDTYQSVLALMHDARAGRTTWDAIRARCTAFFIRQTGERQGRPLFDALARTNGRHLPMLPPPGATDD